MFVTISVILLVYSLLTVYIGWHIWLFLSAVFGTVDVWALTAVLALTALAYMIGRAGRRFLPRPLGAAFTWIGAYWLALFEYLVLLLPIADLAALALRAAGLSSGVYIPALGWTVTGILAVLLIVGSRNAWLPVVRSYDIAIPKPSGKRRELRILAASDLHLGAIVGKRHLNRLVKEAERLRPDLILLPGDVIDDDIAPYIANDMGSVMRKLRAPLGVYAVLGNHEYYGRTIPVYLEQMEAAGIRVLRDETVVIDGSLQLVGRKDKASEGHDPEGRLPIGRLLDGLDRSKPIVLMDHQPAELRLAAEQGADLTLSGHTHRGQLAPNHLLTKRLFDLDWGYRVIGGMHAVVSSGFGTWGPPLRIGSRSEIILLRVRFGD